MAGLVEDLIPENEKVEVRSIDKESQFFSSGKLLEEFIIKEKAFWDSHLDCTIKDKMVSNWSGIKTRLDKFKNQGGEELARALRNLFTEYEFLFSDSWMLEFLIAFPENELGAIDFGNRSQRVQPVTPSQIGYMKLTFLLNFQGLLTKASLAKQEQADRLISRTEQELVNIREEMGKLEEDFQQAHESIRSDNESLRNKESTNFQDLTAKSQKKLEEIEKLFGKHMAIKGPADTWNDMAKGYRRKGRIWLCLSLFILIGFTGVAYLGFQNLPKWFTNDTSFSPNHLKGGLIILAVVSGFAYLLRVFIQLSLSAFHLGRDAFERFQLTQVWLGLEKMKLIDKDDLKTAMVSIFARADTGLLKNDHGPVMPVDPVKIITK